MSLIQDYKIENDDKSFGSAYKEKVLHKFYRRQITKRTLNLSREECDAKYGTGEFFHLNTHTKFSILGGVDEPDELFNQASSLGMSGLAVTETGYISSIPDCFAAAQSSKIKYIAGMSAYFSDYEVKRRELYEKSEAKNHPALIKECKRYRTPEITILAKNAKGYKELLNLNAESWKHGYYYVPKVTRVMLEKYANGNLVILSGSLLDKFVEFGYINSTDNPEYGALGAYQYIEWFNEKFGNDFYVEMIMRCQDSHWGSDLDRLMTVSALMNQFKEEHGKTVQSVITNDVRYGSREDESLYRAMIAIQRDTTLKRIRDYSPELYFKTRSELRGTFHQCYYDRAIDNKTFEIACDNSMIINEKCDNFIADTDPKLPVISDAVNKLKKNVISELIRRGLHKNEKKYEVDGNMVTYAEQVKIELNRFIEKGFESYFLIMQDLVKHSHKQGWQTGPSRGSAGGSLVCYLLGITSMDPLLFKLSFDRFLSPARGGYMLKVTMD